MPKQMRPLRLILAGVAICLSFAGCVVKKQGDFFANFYKYRDRDKTYSSQVRGDHLNYVEGERKRQSQFVDDLNAFWANDSRYRSKLRPQYEDYKELERQKRPDMDMCDYPEGTASTGQTVASAAATADEAAKDGQKSKSARRYGAFEYSTQRH